MNYKYQKGQIFGKRLKVPKNILNKVYNCTLSFDEFIEYQLEDKIPITCLNEEDRKIVEKFGIEKAKTLDWDMLGNYDFKSLLLTIDSSVEDLNASLYELIKDRIFPVRYSERMREIYKDRLFEISEDDKLFDEKERFNYGDVSLKDLIRNWDLYKDKDLGYCLKKDSDNEFNITDRQLKDFMNRFENISSLILDNTNIYQFIYQINSLKDESEQQEYIKQVTDNILEKTIKREENQQVIKLSSKEYKELFKYSSMENYLKSANQNNIDIINKILEELKDFPHDYINNFPIPIDVLSDSDVLNFISTYGLKNIIDFDNECGHFFTKNDCQMLKLMYDMYLRYSRNGKIYEKSSRDKEGKPIEVSYTKDEFYEMIRRMMIYGPTNGEYFKDNKFPDYKDITGEFRVRNADLFISEEAPEELQKLFYTKNITPELLINNPDYISYLKGKNLESCFKSKEIKVVDKNNSENFYHFLSERMDFNSIMSFITEYNDVLNLIFGTDNDLSEINISKEDNKEEIQRKINEGFRKFFIDYRIVYPRVIPKSLIEKYPSMFLSKNVPQDIRDKFYNREFTLDDFNMNQELLDIFGKINIAYGFSEKVSWIIPLFSDLPDFKLANYNRLKIISAFLKIQDVSFQDTFKKYVIDFGNTLDIEKIEYLSEILTRLSLSNSSEIFTFRKELATQILQSPNPLKSLNEIEDVFIRNNIPTVGKIYSCFEILHPDFKGFNFDNSMVSPILKKSSTKVKKIIVFSDLIKSFFGSNNRSINDYLKNIEIGSNLYESIKAGQIQYDSLNNEERNELIIFSKHLATLYNNTMKGKKETFTTTEDVLNDILELSKKLSPNGTLNYNLADRVIRMFCGFTGIDTLEQAKSYINQKIRNADARNRDASKSKMILEQGDFIKGIGDITYLRNILQNGSVSKEYLGSSAGSDSTPLDTDVSMITKSDGTIEEKINDTAAKGYGPIWFVLKNDDRFITTRTSSETFDVKKDMSKMEVFYTGALGLGHYGIRTGFASSEINYIVMDNYDKRVGLEIAMNGFYIPVANKEGQIVFTPNDYEKLREKMSGLSYYNENNYTFSENLVTEETENLVSQIEQSNYETQVKRVKINNIIKKSLEELGLHLKTNIDGDLTEGFVELIDTGSTGRGTNKPGDGDFDFMMRLDKTILSNPSRLNKLKQTILKNLGLKNSSELTRSGDFRLKSVQIDADTNVDIDITFTEKTDKVSYSTDMALQDRLATIQRTNPEKYKYVVANILLAKKVLKQAEVYKPDRGEIPQGGLGGVGIENWILQNGGSFIDAAKSFISSADGKDFSEFKSTYQIWDFGDNHLAEKRGHYSHDNFVSNNMSEVGYNKMVQALKEYIKNYSYSQNDIIGETDSIKR